MRLLVRPQLRLLPLLLPLLLAALGQLRVAGGVCAHRSELTVEADATYVLSEATGEFGSPGYCSWHLKRVLFTTRGRGCSARRMRDSCALFSVDELLSIYNLALSPSLSVPLFCSRKSRRSRAAERRRK